MIVTNRKDRDARLHTTAAACDECETVCPESVQTGTGEWEKQTAHLVALRHGFRSAFRGQLLVLLCSKCLASRGGEAS